MQHQVLLDGKQCSGRGVRFRTLDPVEHEQVMITAGRAIDENASMLELRKVEWRIGVRRMLTAVTKQDGLTEASLATAEWQPVTEQALDGSYVQLFTAKDNAVLTALYRQYHEISETELDSIAKKVLRVV